VTGGSPSIAVAAYPGLMDGPHLGVVLPNYGDAFDPGRLVSAAVAAEEAGLDSGWMTDHVLPPARHAPIYGTIAEALVTVGWLAGRTSRLRLGTSALIVPQREPLLTLKQLVTLDVLSGGRLITAVAAGWMEEEFETLGASFPDRGRRLDQWLDLAGELVRQAPGRVVADGPIPVSDAWLAPGPTRPEGLELWVAGVTRHTLRRAAKTGVWHPVALPLRELRTMAAAFRDEVPEGRVVLRLAVAIQDRLEEDAADDRGRHMVAGPARWVAEQLNDYLEGGADGFVVDLDHGRSGLEDRISRFAEEVRPELVARRPVA
jgi:alkanesulfonate monooxygenase SsuD/methylene tetrahydromethanopterin reductase-like flavin-dependent oxidoreductase (luciferase family)